MQGSHPTPFTRRSNGTAATVRRCQSPTARRGSGRPSSRSASTCACLSTSSALVLATRSSDEPACASGGDAVPGGEARASVGRTGGASRRGSRIVVSRVANVTSPISLLRLRFFYRSRGACARDDAGSVATQKLRSFWVATTVGLTTGGRRWRTKKRDSAPFWFAAMGHRARFGARRCWVGLRRPRCAVVGEEREFFFH